MFAACRGLRGGLGPAALAILIACGPRSAPAPTAAPIGSSEGSQRAAVETALQRGYVDLQATAVAQQARVDAQGQEIAALRTAVAAAASSGSPPAAPKAAAPPAVDPARAALRIGAGFVGAALVGDLETALAMLSPSARAAQGPAVEKLAAALRGCETTLRHASAPAPAGSGVIVSSTFTPPCGNAAEIATPSQRPAVGGASGRVAICTVDLELVDQDWKVTAWSCVPEQ